MLVLTIPCVGRRRPNRDLTSSLAECNTEEGFCQGAYSVYVCTRHSYRLQHAWDMCMAEFKVILAE